MGENSNHGNLSWSSNFYVLKKKTLFFLRSLYENWSEILKEGREILMQLDLINFVLAYSKG